MLRPRSPIMQCIHLLAIICQSNPLIVVSVHGPQDSEHACMHAYGLCRCILVHHGLNTGGVRVASYCFHRDMCCDKRAEL